ncbi:hypothetical protein M5K25_005898 [Dendrobium thyrsiflorum]|uniref:Uncharacterized protein n=1 Tax=Dendrobium thyrsiflorum TaxID=117978 RepID=A0ABD0VA70_DENTH
MSRRCRDCRVASSAPSLLRSFDDFPFQSDRNLRHFDRKQQRELAGCEGPRGRIFKKLVVMFFPRLSFATNLPKLLRQLEHDVEAVINVLQPGPLGIIEHKFSAEEVRKAKATAEQAIKNWKMNVTLENKNHFIKHAASQSSEKDNKPME